MNADGTYRCTATFITQRHLVTASHCVGGWWDGLPSDKYMNLPKPYLLVNGLCVRQGEMCAGGVDMERREIDYIIHDYESLVDLAIIQLRKDQAQFDNMELLPACLYGPWLGSEYKELPRNVEIAAWGEYSFDVNNKLASDRLKVATFATIPKWKYSTSDIPKNCNGRTFCTTRKPNQIKSGDSGGSVYVRTSTLTLMGVVSRTKANRDEHTNLEVTSYDQHINLRSFHADFCRILRLCVEGKSWTESVPTLKWNSVYIARPLTDDPSVIYDGRKLMIEDKDRDELKDYCDKKRQTAKRQRHRSQQVGADPDLPWIAELLRPDNRQVACLAIIVSPMHLITQKRCFAEAKER